MFVLLAIPPAMWAAMFARSGWHLERRSGRGFPNIFFMPFVMSQDAMTDRPRPSHPMCNSQSFRFQMRSLGVPRGTVAPGTNTRQMMAMITIGAMTAATTAIQTGTVSLTVKGNLELDHRQRT